MLSDIITISPIGGNLHPTSPQINQDKGLFPVTRTMSSFFSRMREYLHIIYCPFINANMNKRKPLSTKNRQNREKRDETAILYGLHAVRAALCNPKRRLIKLYATKNALNALADIVGEAQQRGLKIEEVTSESLLYKVAQRGKPQEKQKDSQNIVHQGIVHQGVVLQSAPLPVPDLADIIATKQPLILLDQVTDPRNVGAILRVAAVFGAGAVIMTRHHSPPPSGALTKAASGALEYVPLLAVANLARCMKTLDETGYLLIGLDESGDMPLQTALQTEQPVAFILGGESKGLRRLTRTNCQTLAHLPTMAQNTAGQNMVTQGAAAKRAGAQASFTTLNVATAAALALYEWHRQ